MHENRGDWVAAMPGLGSLALSAEQAAPRFYRKDPPNRYAWQHDAVGAAEPSGRCVDMRRITSLAVEQNDPLNAVLDQVGADVEKQGYERFGAQAHAARKASEHLGIPEWNRWRHDCIGAECDLAGQHLSQHEITHRRSGALLFLCAERQQHHRVFG